MGSTNKTANIGLSQFIGTDKPTWLVDYNNDMAVIDKAIGELQNDSGLIDTTIAELQTNVQNLQSGQGDSATEIAEAKSDVQTLSANYETMHHELVLLENNVTTELDGVKTNIDSKVNDKNGEASDLQLIGNNMRQNSKDLEKGVLPTSDTYLEYHFMDNTKGSLNRNDFGKISVCVGADNSVKAALSAFVNTLSSTDRATILVGVDANGNKYATAPTPTNVNENSDKIATTKWVYNLLRNLGLIQ